MIALYRTYYSLGWTMRRTVQEIQIMRSLGQNISSALFDVMVNAPKPTSMHTLVSYILSSKDVVWPWKRMTQQHGSSVCHFSAIITFLFTGCVVEAFFFKVMQLTSTACKRVITAITWGGCAVNVLSSFRRTHEKVKPGWWRWIIQKFEK